MSERYANCRFCKGNGKIREVAYSFTPGAVRALMRDGSMEWVVVRDCRICDGTGHSGDAMERPA